jgi:23S rRNA pseudouridine955/2504/2580 synthase
MTAKNHTISDDEDGIRLDRWFKRYYPNLTHGLLEKYLRKGLIRVGGKKAKTADRLEPGQEIIIKFDVPGLNNEKRKPKHYLKPEDERFIQSIVLYKDTNIIVVNKPYGLPVQGGNKISRSLDDLLDGLMFDSKERPKLVHRLDRDTSGALVLARNVKTAARLGKGFASKHVDKTYWALVNGTPLHLVDTIDQPLLKKANPKAESRSHGSEYEVMQVDAEGQKAITEYRVLDSLAQTFALVELKPLTGRTHQLRVHMQTIGHPILGDHKYGGSNEKAKALGVENILHLHARRIVIPASVTGGAPVDVLAPLPDHMKKSFRALGLDVPKK